jgi:hypothetical protein
VNPFHVPLSSPPTGGVIAATICGMWIVAALFALPSVSSKYLCEEFVISGGITYYQNVAIY